MRTADAGDGGAVVAEEADLDDAVDESDETTSIRRW